MHLAYADCNAYQKVIYRQLAQQLERVQLWDRLPKSKEANLTRREDIGVLKYLVDRLEEYKDISAVSFSSSLYEKEAADLGQTK